MQSAIATSKPKAKAKSKKTKTDIEAELARAEAEITQLKAHVTDFDAHFRALRDKEMNIRNERKTTAGGGPFELGIRATRSCPPRGRGDGY